MNKTAEGSRRPRPGQQSQLTANVKPPLARVMTAGATPRVKQKPGNYGPRPNAGNGQRPGPRNKWISGHNAYGNPERLNSAGPGSSQRNSMAGIGTMLNVPSGQGSISKQLTEQ